MSEHQGGEPIQVQVGRLAREFTALTDPTPADFSAYWKERWELQGRLINRDFVVPDCDRTQDEVQEHGKTLVVRPEGVTLEDLGQIFPALQSWAVQPGNDIENDFRIGWLDVDDSTIAPFTYSSMATLKTIAPVLGKHGMTLITYVIGSEDHFDRTGEYFDQDYVTASRLLGSRSEGEVIRAHYLADGRLRAGRSVHKDNPNFQVADLGGRFEGVKQARNVVF